MTAVIGLSFLDGILMMADTEESTSVYTKSECDKLYRFLFPAGTVVTGGAGESFLIDCANQELNASRHVQCFEMSSFLRLANPCFFTESG